MVDAAQVRKALESVMDPELNRNLVELGMVRDIQVQDGKVDVTIALTTPACPLKAQIESDVRRAVSSLPDTGGVVVHFGTLSPQERVRALGGGTEEEPSSAQQLSSIGQIVAVISGKGGVGKSLVTSLLAVSLARDGYRVGILDADITGPSIPKMLGLKSRVDGTEFGFIPVTTPLGIQVISINLFLPQDDLPVIWRGPLIGNTIKQFWRDVVWGDLDYLLSICRPAHPTRPSR